MESTLKVAAIVTEIEQVVEIQKCGLDVVKIGKGKSLQEGLRIYCGVQLIYLVKYKFWFCSPFPACYDDVIAYDRPLTDSEVENLYTSAIWKHWKFQEFLKTLDWCGH